MIAINELILECMRNLPLRERFMKNPSALCIEKGCPLPENIKITLIQNAPNTIHIVIPEPNCAAELKTSNTHPIYKSLVLKCLESADFKERFLKNPKPLLEEALGMPLEPNLEVYAHVMKADYWIFIFPGVRGAVSA